LERYHQNSNTDIEFRVDGLNSLDNLSWNSTFEKSGRREKKQIAEDGAIAPAFFAGELAIAYKKFAPKFESLFSNLGSENCRSKLW